MKTPSSTSKPKKYDDFHHCRYCATYGYRERKSVLSTTDKHGSPLRCIPLHLMGALDKRISVMIPTSKVVCSGCRYHKKIQFSLAPSSSSSSQSSKTSVSSSINKKRLRSATSSLIKRYKALTVEEKFYFIEKALSSKDIFYALLQLQKEQQSEEEDVGLQYQSEIEVQNPFNYLYHSLFLIQRSQKEYENVTATEKRNRRDLLTAVANVLKAEPLLLHKCTLSEPATIAISASPSMRKFIRTSYAKFHPHYSKRCTWLASEPSVKKYSQDLLSSFEIESGEIPIIPSPPASTSDAPSSQSIVERSSSTSSTTEKPITTTISSSASSVHTATTLSLSESSLSSLLSHSLTEAATTTTDTAAGTPSSSSSSSSSSFFNPTSYYYAKIKANSLVSFVKKTVEDTNMFLPNIHPQYQKSVMFSGDSTAGYFTLGISLVCRYQPQSRHSFSPIGITTAAEDYESIQKIFGDIYQTIASVEWEKDHGIQVFLGGDLKYFNTIMGLKAPSSSYPVLFCDWKAMKGDISEEEKNQVEYPQNVCHERTYETHMKNLEDLRKGNF